MAMDSFPVRKSRGSVRGGHPLRNVLLKQAIALKEEARDLIGR
jgi:hypothetical protein